jgi:inosine-uridine nucleoside N-ribohydrolase
VLLCALLSLPVLSAEVQAAEPKHTPAAIILDTDLSSDVDDAGAVAVLHALADQGEARILAMMISSGDPWSGPCLAALNTSFGRVDIPIGVIADATVSHVSKYTAFIAKNYSGGSATQGNFSEATELYRNILAKQPDNSVTLVTIGYLSNLARLLVSGPDEHSVLEGAALVARKVKHLVCMGGQFPSGKEWNFYQDVKSTRQVLQYWPTPIDFVGFEIGRRIMTGQILRQATANHPLRVAYQHFNNSTDRESWDQVAVLIATNPSGIAEEPLWYWSSPGYVQIEKDGSNFWRMKLDASQRYAMWSERSWKMKVLIDDLMLKAVYQSKPSP